MSYAVQSGHLEAAELLLKYGADVNFLDSAARTPLHGAAQRGHRELVELLLTAGADPGVKDGLSRDEVYRVYDGESTIGRGETAQIRTDNQDATVSREHAMIIHESGSFGIKPLKEGTNPTFLNEVEVNGGAELADGDLIRIGNTTLKLRLS